MIYTVIGTRPQFIKAAVLSKLFKEQGIQEKIIHTGQHYDNEMSAVFFNELELPPITENTNVGSASHGYQTAQMLIGLENIFQSNKKEIDCILLYGDTNSTVAAALAAAKLNLPIVHVEAGMRSYNRKMPEEINRVVTDHLSSILFCSSEHSKNCLEKEGIKKGVYVSGDIMLDAFNLYLNIAKKKYALSDIIPHDISRKYNLLTVHRPTNTEKESHLQQILDGIKLIDEPFIWPVHPRLKNKIKNLSIPEKIVVVSPLSYFKMLVILESSHKVVTDSGGLQKEAYWMKKPCITIRSETEWVETLHHHWNVLSKPDATEIFNAFQIKVDKNSWVKLYGDGSTANKILAILKDKFLITSAELN